MTEIDERRCCDCANSKPRNDFASGDWWFCGKHKIFITELTRASWIIGCRGKDYTGGAK